VAVKDAGDAALLGIELEASPFAVGKDFLQLMKESVQAGCGDSKIISIGEGARREGVGV
jgi:hypothetical protein